jgi:hypothetical protein
MPDLASFGLPPSVILSLAKDQFSLSLRALTEALQKERR